MPTVKAVLHEQERSKNKLWLNNIYQLYPEQKQRLQEIYTTKEFEKLETIFSKIKSFVDTT